MDFRVILGWLLLNAALLLVIVLLVLGWKRTRPLSGKELAKRLQKETGADAQNPGLSLGEAAFLLRETGRPAEEPLLAAVLTSWLQNGLAGCRMAPKKKLAGFGDDLQPTLSLAPLPSRLTGAEEALFRLFQAGMAETLQSSEAYNWSRRTAGALHDRLLRFEAEGRAALRAEGAVREETQKGAFGLSPRERLIYTPRGLRRALALRQWENHLRQSPETDPAFAVLFGCAEPPQPLGKFCQTLLQGYRAGRSQS